MPVSRRCVIRSSMAAITCGTHLPPGFSAVRHAVVSVRFVPPRTGSPPRPPRAVAPPRRPREAANTTRPHDLVTQRLAVAVRVVGVAVHAAVGVRVVLHERDETRRGAYGTASPVRHTRRTASANAIATASPQDRPSPAWCTSSRSPGSAWPTSRARVQLWLGGHRALRRHVATDVRTDRADRVGQVRVPGAGRRGPRPRPTWVRRWSVRQTTITGR